MGRVGWKWPRARVAGDRDSRRSETGKPDAMLDSKVGLVLPQLERKPLDAPIFPEPLGKCQVFVPWSEMKREENWKADTRFTLSVVFVLL